MALKYYTGDYPEDNFSVQPYPLDDPRVVAHFFYKTLHQYVLYMNPTDKRGYRCIVRFINNSDMASSINRDYTRDERTGLWQVVAVVEEILEGLGVAVQVAKAGNNAHIFDDVTKVTQLGHQREANFLHAHLWVRGDPESEPVPGVPLDGPKPGELFDMRAKTESVPGNERKVSWKRKEEFSKRFPERVTEGARLDERVNVEGDMEKVAAFLRKRLLELLEKGEVNDLRVVTSEPETLIIEDQRVTHAAFRVKKEDLPRTYMVQHGEIFGSLIEWYGKPVERELTWNDNVHGDVGGEEGPGIELDDGGIGFAGWDDKYKVYLRYDDELENNEHCFRILTPA